MEIISHSQIAQAAYQDLLRLHLDERVAAVTGTIEERHRGGRTYLYERFRLGTEARSRYLGEDSPELRDRLARAAPLKSDAQARRQRMNRLTRILRAEGYIATDRDTGSLFLAFARAGMFRLGGTLIGTAAFALYQGELGVRMDSERLAQTGDIDLASFQRLSVALGDKYPSCASLFRDPKAISFDQSIRGLDQLAHDSHDGDLRRFAIGSELRVLFPEIRIETRGNEGWHVEGISQDLSAAADK